MGKILLYVSVILTLVTALLGFINKGHLQDASKALDETKSSLNKTTTQLAGVEKELKSTKATIQSADSEKMQLATQVTSLKADIDKAKGELEPLKTQVQDKTAEIAKKDTEIAALKSKSETPKTTDESADKVKELETVIAENKIAIDKLTEQKISAQEKVTALLKSQNDRKEQQKKNNFSGRVLAVNQAWNFVVLNLGDRNCVSNNMEMLVKRGGQLIGKVRVTSVEPATSIADIVANNIPGHLTVQPNDQVISINEEAKD